MSQTNVKATKDRVRLIGRTCEADGVTWLPQSGSGIEFTATGTRVEIEVVGDDSVDGHPSDRPRFAVLVDGAVVLDDILDEPSRTVEVLSSEHATSAVVEVVHLSEAKRGAIGVRSITVESGEPDPAASAEASPAAAAGAAPVAPTEARDLSIEFIGDSITCGYGVETNAVDEAFSTETENFMLSYAYLAAKELGADYSAVCYSGYGVVSGWTADGTKGDDMLVPSLYDVVASGYEQPWDFSAHRSDVVVINLGTNDFASYTGTDADRMQEFADSYEAFLEQVRERNPQALIVCTLGTMGCQELYPYVEQAAASFSERTGDERVVCYPSDPIDMKEDGIGVGGHPTALTQQKSADKLADVIRQELE